MRSLAQKAESPTHDGRMAHYIPDPLDRNSVGSSKRDMPVIPRGQPYARDIETEGYIGWKCPRRKGGLTTASYPISPRLNRIGYRGRV